MKSSKRCLDDCAAGGITTTSGICIFFGFVLLLFLCFHGDIVFFAPFAQSCISTTIRLRLGYCPESTTPTSSPLSSLSLSLSSLLFSDIVVILEPYCYHSWCLIMLFLRTLGTCNSFHDYCHYCWRYSLSCECPFVVVGVRLNKNCQNVRCFFSEKNVDYARRDQFGHHPPNFRRTTNPKKNNVPPHNPLFTSFLTIYGASCKNIKTINKFSLEKKNCFEDYL